MRRITYLQGDATRPAVDGPKIIAHCCNNLGVWGAGFVLAVSKRWPEAERTYREWYREENQGLPMGAVQFVPVGKDITIANIIGQFGVGWKDDVPPVRYPCLARGLDGVGIKAKQLEATVHLPRLGCDRAGGEWGKVEPLIAAAISRRGVAVFVYDFAP
jgi:O-acetyl-ADP-ribose deacetylase (regulator of RNase III)